MQYSTHIGRSCTASILARYAASVHMRCALCTVNAAEMLWGFSVKIAGYKMDPVELETVRNKFSYAAAVPNISLFQNQDIPAVLP